MLEGMSNFLWERATPRKSIRLIILIIERKFILMKLNQRDKFQFWSKHNYISIFVKELTKFIM